MSHAYQIHKQDSAYFLTLTAVEWADAFMRREHKQILCDSLNYCVNVKGLEFDLAYLHSKIFVDDNLQLRVIGLSGLISAKKASNRPKDQDDLTNLPLQDGDAI